MKSEISRTAVRQDFARTRDLMKLANEMMTDARANTGSVWNQSEAENIANELIAAVTTFSSYVEQVAEMKRTNPMPWDK